MVSKRRLGNEFTGFHIPNIPRAPRSSRSRGAGKRTVEDGQLCAFEMLASLAGKLLQESESSASSNASEGNDHLPLGKNVVKQESQVEGKPSKMECHDQASFEVSAFASESIAESNGDMKKVRNSGKDAILKARSVLKKFTNSDQASCDLKSVIGGTAKVDEGFSVVGDSCIVKLEKNGFEQEQQSKGLGARKLVSSSCISKVPKETRMTFPETNNSDRDVKFRSRSDLGPKASFSRIRNSITLGYRDDDEKFTRLNKFSNRFKASRPLTRFGDQRVRKLLTSRYWKSSPKLKNYEVSGADGRVKPMYRKRKICCDHDKRQYNILHKKSKICDWQSALTSDGGVSSESVSNSPEKFVNGDKSNSAAALHGATKVSSAFIGQQVSRHSKDSHVKFSIKSFRIPELLVEVPENATVGSLKRAVMEAVTALLGGGLRVGMLLQGKKIRDDSRTLSEIGISNKDKLDTLGFTLEPNALQSPVLVNSKDPPLPLPYEAAENITRSPVVPPAIDSGISDAVPDPVPLTNSGKHTDSNHEPVSSHIDIPTNSNIPESKALVPVPAMNADALAVIPLNQKPKKSELAQRRTRRPFSVTEVEALVHAVEELGTGRWRGVKLRAFENAKHRTYVDLKDKWKTLVHTATISPQQRRGEPVPQELLDRVLAAHAYWSQHQGKQQGKLHQPETPRLLEIPTGQNAAGAIQVSVMM